MTRKVAGFVMLSLLLNLMFSTSIFSQNKEIKDAEKYKSRIEKRGTGNKPIIVKLKDNTKLKGIISEIKDDYFVLKNGKTGTSSDIYYNQIKDIDKAFSKTENVIAIAGAGFGFTLIIVCFVARKCQS